MSGALAALLVYTMVQITGAAQASQFSPPKLAGYNLDDKYYVPDCVK